MFIPRLVFIPKLGCPLARFCLRLALTLAASASLAAPATCQTLVTSRGALASTDHVDWAVLGDNTPAISNPIQIPSSQGTSITVSQAGHGLGNRSNGAFATLPQAGSPEAEGTLLGNFAPGDIVLDALDGGTVSLTFPQGVYGGGAQVAGPKPTASGVGAFTVQIQAFGRNNTLLASFTKGGTFTANADNSALFLGIVDASPDIYRISYTGITPHYDLFLNRFDIAALPAVAGLDHTHVLWTNTNGIASIWNYDTAKGTYTYINYSLGSGWTAKTIADGSDGKTRLLWTNASGMMSLWSLDNTTGAYTHHEFGPCSGWTTIGLSVGSDNTTHVLWTNVSGQMSLWNYDAVAGTYSYRNYGPFSGWTAKSIADGPDGKMRVLWLNTSGQSSLWSLDNTTGTYTNHEFGPFSCWTAIGLSVGADNTTHVLWTNTNGTTSLWNYNAVAGTYDYRNYGPFGNWRAKASGDGPDGKMRVLWLNTDGTTSLWGLNNATGMYTNHEFGPFACWTAVAVSAGT